MGSKKLARRESILIWIVAGAALLLRLLLVFRYRFDSDEPQHMHVAWGWSRGLMQYRDVFDNHMPLFHLLSAPLFRIAGDDVNVLFRARLWVLPFFFASAVLLFVIAERLFGRRVAAWATLFGSLFPPFFLGVLEYRTDDLWVVCWLACIAIFLSDIEPLARAILAGAFLGLAFAVSMKSVLFGIAIVAAFALTYAMTRRFPAPPLREIASRLTAFTAVALLAPVTIGVFFALSGAWKQFVYCVFEHNESAPFDHWWRVLWAIPLVPLVVWIADRYAAADGDARTVRRRLFVFLLAGGYFVVLSAFWPVLSAESYLPFYPLAAILITPLLIEMRSWQRLAIPVAASLVLAIAADAHVWRNEAHEETALLRQVLQITRPNDEVMDLKGECVFRRRPYWLVLESITHRKMRHHLLRDDIAQALVRSGTSVLASIDFPIKTKVFVRHNYVRWGRLWVAGHRLRAVADRGVTVPFRVGVPSRYIVLGRSGRVEASVDGVPVKETGIDLAPGWHRLTVTEPVVRPLVIWSGVTRTSNFLVRLRETEDWLDGRGRVRRLAAADDDAGAVN